MSIYNVNIEVRVDDPESLRKAAGISYINETGDDPVSLFGPIDDPDVGACLVQLLDPSTLPGAEIIETSADTL